MKYISCKELAQAHETFNVLAGMQDEVEVVDENGEPMEFMTKLTCGCESTSSSTD